MQESGDPAVVVRTTNQLLCSALMAAMRALWLLAAVSCWSSVHAQPSPQVQKDISAAIKKAASSHSAEVDYTQFVNVFIGTDNFGDVW
ncbi:hypothetical protein TRAPUB_1722 [Trametes pubescens]|uniref:Uncharacterized protein n=1 Tax=Trametes pubescens TaxID=154538 RepID=A0A1M2VIK0_TRAPU|nr:hypothetical protein TRAPUB_1722 [Trametes pubescens]